MLKLKTRRFTMAPPLNYLRLSGGPVAPLLHLALLGVLLALALAAGANCYWCDCKRLVPFRLFARCTVGSVSAGAEPLGF